MIIALSIVAYFVFGWLTLVYDEFQPNGETRDQVTRAIMLFAWPFIWTIYLGANAFEWVNETAKMFATWLKNRKEPNDPK